VVLTRKVGRPGFLKPHPFIALSGFAVDPDHLGNDPERFQQPSELLLGNWLAFIPSCPWPFGISIQCLNQIQRPHGFGLTER
jgi:hypothetical protein